MPIVGFLLGIKYQSGLGDGKGRKISYQNSPQILVTATPTPGPSLSFLQELEEDFLKYENIWKTYTSVDAGISFKYPHRWNIENNGLDWVKLGTHLATLSIPYKDTYPTSDYPYFTLSYFDNPKNLSIKQFHEEFLYEHRSGMAPAGFYSDKDKEISYPGGIKVRYGNLCGPTCSDLYVWKHNNKIFLFKVNFNTSSFLDKNLEIIQDKLLDKMVSTIKLF